MKIKLRFDLPVDPKHGMAAGRVLAVARKPNERERGDVAWYVIGDTGEEVGVLFREADVLKAEREVAQ